MSDPLRLHPLVPRDLATAISWYEDISPELANRLRASIRAAFHDIRQQPLSYPIAFDDVRFVRVARFPYMVQFRIQSETPFVLGVFHSASDPTKWQKRAQL